MITVVALGYFYFRSLGGKFRPYRLSQETVLWDSGQTSSFVRAKTPRPNIILQALQARQGQLSLAPH